MVRELDGVADRAQLLSLWSRAFPGGWPVLSDGLSLLRKGYVAVVRDEIVGAVAIDCSVQFIAVDRSFQRQGIGSTLLERSLDDLALEGVEDVPVGSAGSAHIWPGVPSDLPGAVPFFSNHGWEWEYTATDLVGDLVDPSVAELDGVVEAVSDVTIALARPHEIEEVLAFETCHFPRWSRWFGPERRILVARGGGDICGTLLLDGPGPVSVFWPMLGADCGTIGCVGVQEEFRNQGIGTALVARATSELARRGVRACHIGWVVGLSFYERLGYMPWRTYEMGRCSSPRRALNVRANLR
jgi:beta-N-acetylhexosaminidase